MNSFLTSIRFSPACKLCSGSGNWFRAFLGFGRGLRNVSACITKVVCQNISSGYGVKIGGAGAGMFSDGAGRDQFDTATPGRVGININSGDGGSPVRGTII